MQSVDYIIITVNYRYIETQEGQVQDIEFYFNGKYFKRISIKFCL